MNNSSNVIMAIYVDPLLKDTCLSFFEFQMTIFFGQEQKCKEKEVSVSSYSSQNFNFWKYFSIEHNYHYHWDYFR